LASSMVLCLMNASVWEARDRRAADLAESYPFARDLLSFYRAIARFQKETYALLAQNISGDMDVSGVCPLHGGALDVHLPLLLSVFPNFLSLVKRTGPDALAQLAGELAAKDRQAEWPHLLDDYWRKELPADSFPEGGAGLFFPKTFLQPYAEFLADNHSKEWLSDSENWQVAQGGEALCPLCGSRPQLSVLRTEAEGAKRSLLC